MTKKNKILLSTCLIAPTIVAGTAVLTSCSSTNEFVKPAPINLNESFNKMKSTFDGYTVKLNSMFDFNDVFEYEDDMVKIFNSDEFNFNNSVTDVKVDITPVFKKRKLIYSFKFIVSFKLGTNLKFDSIENYTLENNKLISPSFNLNNCALNLQSTKSVNFWINEANVVEGSSYAAIKVYDKSFSFIYNDQNYNIESSKTINTSLSNFTDINIYINSAVQNTYGTQWFSVEDTNPATETPRDINVNIEYSYQPISALNADKISTANYNFNINPIYINEPMVRK